ncbi:MAG: hypothetical protein BWX98_02566 [Candidatus Aminicenantes bacterium ADurb.Bin147]|nr:MAG: hypothetical protein BWX98_02566 [Candidatus Aminicenantes bacterium ADurb.Bin147]
MIRPERVDGDEDDVRSFFPRDVQDGLDPVGKDASGSGRDEPQPGFARPGRKRDAFPDLVDRPGRPGLGLFEVSFVQDRLAAGVFEDNLELDFAAWGSGGGEPGGRMDVMDDPDPEIQDALGLEGKPVAEFAPGRGEKEIHREQAQGQLALQAESGFADAGFGHDGRVDRVGPLAQSRGFRVFQRAFENSGGCQAVDEAEDDGPGRGFRAASRRAAGRQDQGGNECLPEAARTMWFQGGR